MAKYFLHNKVLFLILGLSLAGSVLAQSQPDSHEPERESVLIDDFEDYSDGDLPTGWSALYNGKLVPMTEQFVNDSEWFYIRREGRNSFVRAFADGEAVHINKGNGDGFDWNLDRMPVLAWDWRANKIPEGAREDRDNLNDSGAGVYVIFSMDGFLIKRPKSIKYVYSSTLDVGTVVSYGKLQVIVVASAKDGINSWSHIERNVVEDYRRVFGKAPPSKPLSIRLWSDSDNTKTISEVDFDNVMLHSGR